MLNELLFFFFLTDLDSGRQNNVHACPFHSDIKRRAGKEVGVRGGKECNKDKERNTEDKGMIQRMFVFTKICVYIQVTFTAVLLLYTHSFVMQFLEASQRYF